MLFECVGIVWYVVRFRCRLKITESCPCLRVLMHKLKLPSLLVLFLNVKFFDRPVRLSFKELKLLLLHSSLVFDLLILNKITQADQTFEASRLLLLKRRLRCPYLAFPRINAHFVLNSS